MTLILLELRDCLRLAVCRQRQAKGPNYQLVTTLAFYRAEKASILIAIQYLFGKKTTQN